MYYPALKRNNTLIIVAYYTLFNDKITKESRVLCLTERKQMKKLSNSFAGVDYCSTFAPK